jgi:hypothetical protein
MQSSNFMISLQKIRTVEQDGKTIKLQIVSLNMLASINYFTVPSHRELANINPFS